jgi:DNA-binding NtrC family response regulator
MPTHVLAPRLRELTYSLCRVVVTDGPGKGTSAAAKGAELAIGADASNQLVLADPTVSRHHCVIVMSQRGAQLRDLDSTNGTFLAGHRVESGWLEHGSQLRVGVTTLRFELTAEEVHEPLSDEDRFGRALGRSAAMRRVFALLPRVAAAESTVLLEGETGTGKSLLAEAVHLESARAKGPFLVLDCGAIPPSLIESELFGHEKGAFTGAVATREGIFEAARGGTVFLDEIGELPLDMQPKLLRALEDRVVKRVGGSQPIKLDVRLIAATNKDLRQEVNRGRFRSDLYYRLDVVRLRLPPLRERRDDIALLVETFYEQFAGEGQKPPADLVATLSQHDWPGNVRELRGAVERAVLMGDPEVWSSITADAPAQAGAPEEFDASLSFRAAKERATMRWERWYVTELVKRHGGNLSAAARAARMDRTHLRELLRRYKAEGGDGED